MSFMCSPVWVFLFYFEITWSISCLALSSLAHLRLTCHKPCGYWVCVASARLLVLPVCVLPCVPCHCESLCFPLTFCFVLHLSSEILCVYFYYVQDFWPSVGFFCWEPFCVLAPSLNKRLWTCSPLGLSTTESCVSALNCDSLSLMLSGLDLVIW